MATAQQQDEARTFLTGCRVAEVDVDGSGIAYLHLEAPAARAVTAVLKIRIVEIEWVDEEERPGRVFG